MTNKVISVRTETYDRLLKLKKHLVNGDPFLKITMDGLINKLLDEVENARRRNTNN
jgi:hypothetical protein